MAENSTLEELVEEALAQPQEFLGRVDDIGGFTPWQIGWVRGLALREAGRHRDALTELTHAIELVADVGPTEAARVRSSRSIVHLSLGDPEAALADAEWAASQLHGRDAGRNESQRAIILFRLGRHHEGLEAMGRALPLLDAAGDDVAIARVHGNRAAIHAIVGDLDAARADNTTAATIYARLGNQLGVGITEHNLGFLEGRAGDTPSALAHFDRAAELLQDLIGPARMAISKIDRAEVLADAGLHADALTHVEEAIAALRGEEERIVLAEAELLAARLQAAAGSFAEAAETASRARAELERLQKSGWATKARWFEVIARRQAGESLDPTEATALAEELGDAGWQLESLDLLLLAVDVAVETGNVPLARDLVGRLRRSQRDLPALQHVGRHRAIARTRLASGDRRGARRSITAALKLLHEHRLSFGSAELRAHASRHGQGLFEIAIQLALEDDRADDALVALDLLRDTEQPVWSRPPTDAGLAADLEHLRRLDADHRQAARDGEEDPRAGAQRAQVERRIREALRRQTGPSEAAQRLDVVELHAALGGRALRSWFVHEGRLGVVSVDDNGRRLSMLGPVDDVTQEIDSWRFALRRLAEGRGSARRLEDAARSAAAATERLTSLLALDDHPEGVGLVVVPTGVVRGLAWHALPILAGATVNVVPSARYWSTQSLAAVTPGRVLAAAGPGLRAAEREVAEVASRHGRCVALAESTATVAAVTTALDGAAIGHLAAHGTFRWDNPLFSNLHFADGPLWLHDFERLEQPPRTLVLSACDMAMDRVVAGDAVVGMASGLLRLGVRTLIAPVVPVPDEEVADFMVALHERMAAGASGGEALAAIAATWNGETPKRQAVKQSFVSFGA